MMNQRYTSASTSRRQVPAMHKALMHQGIWCPDDINIDIGGGKFDLTTDFLSEANVKNVIYNPFNRSKKDNDQALKAIRSGQAFTATVSNVLNVIKEPAARQKVIRLAAKAAKTGVVFFTVYEGNRSGHGCKTRDGWQSNRKLASYLKEINKLIPTVKVRTIGGVRMITGGVPYVIGGVGIVS